eukprot:scaffold17522_cov34-Prasinocladus_malaysianus.AAC.2
MCQLIMRWTRGLVLYETWSLCWDSRETLLITSALVFTLAFMDLDVPPGSLGSTEILPRVSHAFWSHRIQYLLPDSGMSDTQVAAVEQLMCTYAKQPIHWLQRVAWYTSTQVQNPNGPAPKK